MSRRFRFVVVGLLAGLSALLSPGLVARAQAASGNVLICATNDYANDVQSKLSASGKFSSVDLFDCGSDTPSVSKMKNYSAVFVFSDDSFADPTALGDNMAAYVQAGGHIVEATFNWDVGPIGGNWQSGGYSPLNFNGDQLDGDGPLTLVPVDAGSPLLAGVSSFSGGTSSYRNDATLASGATLVARWNDSAQTPLVAVKNCTVALNFYPPSTGARSDFWDASTDGVRLMTNALQYCAGHAGNTAAWYTAQNHLGYCSVAGNTDPFTGQPIPPGTFLLLLADQPDTDPNYKGAVIADYLQGEGITCDSTAGYTDSGTTVGALGPGDAGPYPYYTKS